MHDRELFIDGRWRAAREGRRATIADPATGEPVGSTAIADARQSCVSGGFTGAAPTLAQYRVGQFDADLRCGGAR